MHIMKKLLSLTLSALLILSLLPAGVMAEETTGWTVTASVYSENVGYMTDGEYSTDGNRWTSNGGIGTGQSYESVSITITFDSPTNVQSVKLCSGTDYAVAYTAYVSSTGEDNSWTEVSSSTEGTATDDYQTISINSTSVSYIKIECTQTVDGYSWWSIYELTVVESNGWTAEATATGEGDSVDYMFDNDTTTRWSSGGGIGDGQSNSSVTVTVNFGEATAVSSVSLLSNDDYAVAYSVSMSTDGSNWTEVASSTEGTVNDDGYQIISFTETTGSYLKIECTQVNEGWRYWSIYELAINVDTTSSGDDEEMTTWQITASVGYDPEKMIDGVRDTSTEDNRWTTYSAIGYDDSKLESAYVTLNLGSAENVSSIRLLSCNDYALDYTLEYSNDNETWTEISSSYEVSNDYQIITFDTVYAQYLRITCTKSCEGNYWSIYEIDINKADEESEPVLPSLYGWALTLDGRIGVTYYFDMTDVDEADSYVLNVTIGDRSETISHGDSKTDGAGGTTQYYRYTVYVGVAEINSTITATISYGDNVVEVTDYSVAEYCSAAIEGGLAEKDLCTALLTYGNYARIVNGNSTELDSSYTLAENYSVTIDDKFDTIPAEGYLKTLALGDVIYIRVYMATSQTVKVDGVEYEPVTSSDYDDYTCYIEFPVSAKNMDEIYTVCSTDGTELTSYSVYSYIKNQLANDEADDNLKNLCKAIYNYSQAAEDYSGWH